MPFSSKRGVATSQAPSSEIDVSVRLSGVTCRSERPPKLREFARISRPPRQTSLPTRVAFGSSILSVSAELSMVTGCSCAPAGGGEMPEQAATSRQSERRKRFAT